MPFRFRLKSLMRHREFKLREAQAALGAAEAIRMKILSSIDKLNEMVRRESEQFEREQENGIGTSRYLLFKGHLSFLEHELLLLNRELQKATAEAEAQKQVMIEWDRSVKAIESIETRDRELYKSIQSHKQQKQLDDVAVFGDYRNRNGGGDES
jgi:flagellar export protein FliJ